MTAKRRRTGMASRLALAGMLVLSTAAALAQAAACGPGSPCPKSSPCCSEFGQCGSGAQQCAGGCQAMWSNQPTSCQPNPICKNLNITFQPSDYNNPDVFVPILAYDGTGSGNGNAPFTLDAGNLGKGPEGVLLQMTIGSQAKISTTDYFLYGTVQATLRHNARQGLVAAFILMSDVKDEVDWEFTTADGTVGYTNYFSLGQYVSGHGTDVTMPKKASVSDWHTFGLNWTPNQLQWTIDGTVVRTLTKSQAGNQFPRTPARVQLSTWAGGNATSPQGTQEWAGGLIDWTSQEYKTNGYYSQELQSYSISCADPSSSGVSTASKRAPSSGSGSSYTSWVYTGSNSTAGPAFQLSTASISPINNPAANGSPAAPGAAGQSKTTIANSWNGSGVKAKSSGGGGLSSSSALKYGVPIAGGVAVLILLWAACVWLVRKRRVNSVGKNNPLGAPGTAIVGSGTGLAHNVGTGGAVGALLPGNKRASQYAPLNAADDDAPMGAQRVGAVIGPAAGPRPGPMSGVNAGPINTSYPPQPQGGSMAHGHSSYEAASYVQSAPVGSAYGAGPGATSASASASTSPYAAHAQAYHTTAASASPYQSATGASPYQHTQSAVAYQPQSQNGFYQPQPQPASSPYAYGGAGVASGAGSAAATPAGGAYFTPTSYAPAGGYSQPHAPPQQQAQHHVQYSSTGGRSGGGAGGYGASYAQPAYRDY